MVDCAIRRVIGMTRALRDGLKHRIGGKIDPTSALLLWMIAHSATILNMLSVGPDGRAPVEKARGTRAIRTMPDFGARVLYKALSKDTKKLKARWE